LGDSEGQGSLACCSPMGVTKSWAGLSDWTANNNSGSKKRYSVEAKKRKEEN